MLSFWEQDAVLDAELIVVGAGLIGLQTALEWRERRPHDRVMVLERAMFPSGASSRNAGFACFGSLTEILHDLDLMGEAETLALVERRWRGLSKLRQRLGDEAMGYEALGGFELLFEPHLPALEHLDALNHKLQPLFGSKVFSLDAAGLRASGFGPQVKALVRNPFEAQVHSGKLMRALSRLAGEQGIEQRTGVQVQGLEEEGGQVYLHAAEGVTFRANRVAVCTNGITHTLLPHAGITPGRGQILVTEPVPGLPWRGTYHVEEGFYYFRNVGERVLLGGGRHLDFAGEATSDIGLTATIQSALEQLLRTTILPGREARISHRWAGVMGFSADKRPVVRKESDRVVLGFGCNGMGVALGAEIARDVVDLLA